MKTIKELEDKYDAYTDECTSKDSDYVNTDRVWMLLEPDIQSFAQQTSIAFAEWAKKNYTIGGYYWFADEDRNEEFPTTTEQLFDLFIKQQDKK